MCEVIVDIFNQCWRSPNPFDMDPAFPFDTDSYCFKEVMYPNSSSSVNYDYLLILWYTIRGLYFGPKMIPAPPFWKWYFFPSHDTFFDSHCGLFGLILPYFAFILPFYFPFSHFLSPFFLFLWYFPPFSLCLFIFFPPNDIGWYPPGGGGGGDFPI